MSIKLTFAFCLLLPLSIAAQEIISLPASDPRGVIWDGEEKEYFSNTWQTQVITNVSKPAMEVYRADPATANGTSVIIAPGGGLYAQSVESEGREVARWLNEQGITAFVLKYRLVPTGKDGVAEVMSTKPYQLYDNVGRVMPLSVVDGLEAISYIRQNAKDLGVEPDRIGFMGFSAGGAVTIGVANYCTAENRPDFLVPVYPWTTAITIIRPKKDAPPMLVVCASDDPLDLAPGSVELYSAWLDEGLPVGLHMYSKGGHGFGMRKQNLPSDQWLQRVHEWMVAEGIAE